MSLRQRDCLTGHNVTNINIIYGTGEFIEMNGLQETGMTWGKDGGQYGGSLRPSEILSLWHLTFSLSFTTNIPPYFNDRYKSKWVLLFLVKKWVSVIFGVIPFVSLQGLVLVSRVPAGVHLCLWSDSASISEELWAELQETLSQTKLRYRRHSRDSVYNWFSNRRKGDIKTQ